MNEFVGVFCVSLVGDEMCFGVSVKVTASLYVKLFVVGIDGFVDDGLYGSVVEEGDVFSHLAFYSGVVGVSLPDAFDMYILIVWCVLYKVPNEARAYFFEVFFCGMYVDVYDLKTSELLYESVSVGE